MSYSDTGLCPNHRRYKSSPNIKPKEVDQPLVAVCGTGHKPRPLCFSRCDLGQIDTRYISAV